MPKPTKPDLETEIDRLYALPLAEFTTARNELAKRLRAGGDRKTADEIKALAKPSVTAWAVNALYHHERQRFAELLEAAAAVRAALAGEGDRRQADVARRKALRNLLGRAAKMLARDGHAATPANRQRISHTLEALTARDPAHDGPPPGRLTSDLEPQGFDVLAGLAPSLAPPGATVAARRSAQPAKQAAATAAAATRAELLETARRKLDEAQAALLQLDREVEEADAAADAAARGQARLAEQASAAERRARLAVAAAAEARKEAAAAKAAATKAKTARRRGLSRLATAQRQLERRKG